MPSMDPELRYDKLKAPWRGHALCDLVKERYNNQYDFAGGMAFQTIEEMKEVTIYFDTLAPEEDKVMDPFTGFPKNQYTYDEMVAKHSDFPTWEEIDTLYQQYLDEYNAYAGVRERQYPPIKEQLDLLYHDIDSGLLGESAKQSSFYQTINTVKTNNQ